MLNKKKIKKLLVSTAALALSAPLAASIPAAAADLEIDAKSALLADGETGQVLFEQNADEPQAIASMTKMLVEYILYKEVEDGTIDWQDEVVISPYAAELSQNLELSNVPLVEGEKYTYEELNEALAIYSANGATVAIAEGIAGSEEAFVKRMQELVESWGIEDAKLYNTTGLNNENLYGHHQGPADAENMMSARSIATVGFLLLKDQPEVLKVASVPEKKFREGTDDEILMHNFNWMLPGLIYEREGVDGLKTGTTDLAGAAFTGTAKQGDRRVLTVVMGAGDGEENKAQRFTETGRLMDEGFDNWVPEEVIKKGQTFDDFKTVPVADGKKRQVEIEAAEAFDYLIKTGAKDDDELEYEVVWDEEALNADGELQAPFKAGTVVGHVQVKTADKDADLGFLGQAGDMGPVELVTAEGGEKAGFFMKMWNGVRDFFSNLSDRF